MKKAVTLIITLFTVLFVSFAIISFMYYSSSNQTNQYQKDLAELRGYWAAYGAKERDNGVADGNDILYYYHFLNSVNERGNDTNFLYIVRGVQLNDTQSTFEIRESERNNINTIRNNDIYIRTLEINGNNVYDEIVSYK
jgi:hypothetical protein